MGQSNDGKQAEPTAEVRHGKWITRETAYEWIEDCCSVCGHYEHAFCKLEYCPACGAKMEVQK